MESLFPKRKSFLILCQSVRLSREKHLKDVSKSWGTLTCVIIASNMVTPPCAVWPKVHAKSMDAKDITPWTPHTPAGGGKVCLRVVPVKARIHGASKTVEMYALLDSRSDVSLCEKELAVELGVRGDQKAFYLTT